MGTMTLEVLAVDDAVVVVEEAEDAVDTVVDSHALVRAAIFALVFGPTEP